PAQVSFLKINYLLRPGFIFIVACTKQTPLPCGRGEKRGWEGLLITLRLKGLKCSSKQANSGKLRNVTIK
ncbi:MAG TPA: hypothetical protein PLZ21_11090, partial [Armatimonadota bacterium]|nr:hypothetical protein [Armatimonadota bacterium]